MRYWPIGDFGHYAELSDPNRFIGSILFIAGISRKFSATGARFWIELKS